MSNSMFDNAGVPELNSHNWTTKSVRMQSILVINDLWNVSQCEPVYITATKADYNDHDLESLSLVYRAKAKILLRVSTELLPHLTDSETSHEV